MAAGVAMNLFRLCSNSVICMAPNRNGIYLLATQVLWGKIHGQALQMQPVLISLLVQSPFVWIGRVWLSNPALRLGAA